MSDVPAPMTPADCDLRGMEWMALHGRRLFTSGWYLAAMKDPRGGIAALKLWWAAMLQCPAGSLPSDEDELCLIADFGQDRRGWKKHRAVAMRGFVLCSDNRYYHPVVAEQAVKAYESRLKASASRQSDAERLRRWRTGHPGSHPPEKPNGQAPPETRFTPVSTSVSSGVSNALRNADETRGTLQNKEKESLSFFDSKTPLSPPVRESEPSVPAVWAARQQSATEVASFPTPVSDAIGQIAHGLKVVPIPRGPDRWDQLDALAEGQRSHGKPHDPIRSRAEQYAALLGISVAEAEARLPQSEVA